MEINIEDIKEFTTIGKPLIDSIFNTFITPKFKQLDKWFKTKKIDKEYLSEMDIKLKDYIFRSYNNFSYLNVLVFPNQQVEIKNIYYPLTLESAKDSKSFKIDIFPKEVIESCDKLVISDTAGMGKSTLSKWIALSLIEQQLSIPILIELKKLNKSHLILDEILKQIESIGKSIDKDFIIKLLELGNFTIILDGFDEIAFENRETVLANIKDFVSKAYRNWYILTSRPESTLSAFGEFQVFHIKPLKIEESYELIKRYDSLNTNKVSKQLIEDIKARNPQVKEFLRNPFLVSLLYRTYTYNKDIPSKKSTFYDEVYSALYKHHDLSKDGFKRNKESGLDFQDFRFVLRQLAFDTAKIGEVDYTEQQLIKHLKEAKVKCIGIEFKESKFIEDLESSVPLFVRDGNKLKWAHKSLQDYFAAEYISTSKDKEKIIQLIYQSGKENYLNIIDFLYELEYKAFRKIIIKNIINEYIEFTTKNYKGLKNIPLNQIEERLAISFILDFALFIPKGSSKEALMNPEDFFYKKNFNAEEEEIKKSFERPITYRTRTMGSLLFNQYFGSDIKLPLLNLIKHRNESIFITNRTKVASIAKLKNFPTGKVILLNDDPKNIINSKENFGFINAFIKRQRFESKSLGNAPLLDITKCKKLIEKIENEESIDKEIDLFSDI